MKSPFGDPGLRLDIGGLVSPTSPGEYSNIRVYTRAVPEDEAAPFRSKKEKNMLPSGKHTENYGKSPFFHG